MHCQSESLLPGTDQSSELLHRAATCSTAATCMTPSPSVPATAHTRQLMNGPPAEDWSRAGRAYHERLRQDSLDTIPHLLPDEPEVRAMIHDLPLELVDFVDEKDYYCCVLKIPEAYALPGPPLKLKVSCNTRDPGPVNRTV